MQLTRQVMRLHHSYFVAISSQQRTTAQACKTAHSGYQLAWTDNTVCRLLRASADRSNQAQIAAVIPLLLLWLLWML
jgi:hypothetical protein